MEDLGTPLPAWVEAITAPGERVSDDRAAIDAAIEIATQSAREGNGPFGALIVDAERTVVATGWNRVIEVTDSTAHAEIEAIRAAEVRLGTHDLAAPERAPLTLFSSCAPCVMCFGAIYWSGLARVVAAASAEAAEQLGFQEGPVTEAMWATAREDKGITFEPDAKTTRDPDEPFRVYQNNDGPLY